MHNTPSRYWQHSDPDPAAETPANVCKGKCNAAYRAAENRVRLHGGEHDLEPWPGQPVWCAPCVTDLRGALTDWPELAGRLQDEIGSGVRAQMGEYVSGSKNRPIHEHEAPSLLLDEMAEWLPEWAATIARDRGLQDRPGARRGSDPVRAIEDACVFLRTHLDWHVNGRPEDEWEISEEFGLDLGRYTRRARHITGATEPEPVRIIGVPCPHCDRKALEHEIEEGSSRRTTIQRFVYGDDGDVQTRHRAATDDEATILRLRPPKGVKPEEFEPTVPERATETTATTLEGAVTSYIRCRRCKPIFRMTLEDYHRWTRMLAAGEEVRSMATADKLREVFGNSIPTQYRSAS